MEIQAFDIQLPTNTYTVEPQDNGTFRLMDGEEKIGVVYPEVAEDGTTWKTMDELENDFVQQVGALISAHAQ